MMSRLTLTGQLQPGDLSRLSRLAVLNSISMLVNVRADLADSLHGNRLEQEITSLWNSSEAFYEVVSSSPLDAGSVNASAVLSRRDGRRLSGSIQARWVNCPESHRARRTTVRRFRAFSHRSDRPWNQSKRTLAAAGRTPADRSPGSLRQEAQLMANDSGVTDPRPAMPGEAAGRDAIVTELTDLLERVQSFSRLLPIQPCSESCPGLVPRGTPADVARRGPNQSLEWKTRLEPPWRTCAIR